ncbi:MAG: MBL fold metallo-hydrolase [Bryobacteraceae bacterium]
MKTRYWIGLSAVSAAAVAWMKVARPSFKRYRLELPTGGGSADIKGGSVRFIGTATTLIECAGMTILTDPNFLHRGEQVHIGYGLHSTRLTDPAMDFEELPPIDFVLLSHLHEDHFDKLVERKLPRDTPILTTASAARILTRRGFTRSCGLRTWDSVFVTKGEASLRVTSMPGRHGPLLVSAFLPDVMGSMLEFRTDRGATGYNLYISGDTLFIRDLLEIPERYPDVDLALLHLGGTRVLGVLVTMDAGQGIQAAKTIAAHRTIPIHFNDYDVFRDPLDNFVRAVKEAGLQERVRYLRAGERYAFGLRSLYMTDQPVTLQSNVVSS